MIARILLAAIFAGVIAGLVATTFQSLRVVPLILEAEKYETADSGHSHGTQGAAAGHSHGDSAAHTHGDDAEAWAPADGTERTLYTALANVLAGVAFSMILTAGILLSNRAVSVKSGLIWGACGFVAFVLAPNFGLPPELPGMPVGDLAARQIWWTATVACTGAAMALVAWRPGLATVAAGLVLAAVPHLYGAPAPESHDSAVPAALAAQFATATVLSSALFWAVLGAVLGYLLSKLPTGASQGSGALPA